MYRKILVPVDSSSTAQRGLQEAVKLAQTLNASLVLLHVVESMPMMMEVASAATWEQLITSLRENGQRTLDQARDSTLAGRVACETYLEDAAAQPVSDIIIEQARLRHCDLIVMGTHGRRGIGRMVMGSDAETVIRTSPVPVLLVRAPVA